MILNNYKLLFIFKIVKTLLDIFLDSFFVLYFITLSNSNILPFGIYKLIGIVVMEITIVFLRNRCKNKNRLNILRISLLLYLLYFLIIFILKENIVKYMYLIGAVYGVQRAFFFSVYNLLESDSISNDDRGKFNGDCRSLSNILGIIFPLLLGSIIFVTNFNYGLIFVMVMLIVLFFLSFKIKDNNIPRADKANIRGFFKIVKSNEALKSVFNSNLFSGLTYSSGAFLSIITIYIIKVCDNSMSLGIFTSIIGFILAIVSLLFGHFIKKSNYNLIMIIMNCLTIIAMIVMMFYCNFITIVVFNILSRINWELLYLINVTSQGNLTNISEIRSKYKVEFYQFYEFSLFVGRFFSYLLFLLLSIVSVKIILPIFIIFLILFMFNSIKVQINMK